MVLGGTWKAWIQENFMYDENLEAYNQVAIAVA